MLSAVQFSKNAAAEVRSTGEAPGENPELQSVYQYKAVPEKSQAFFENFFGAGKKSWPPEIFVKGSGLKSPNSPSGAERALPPTGLLKYLGVFPWAGAPQQRWIILSLFFLSILF
ncbi:MAG: hypothetical protein LBR53_01225 [Deltaproteobacteria bacterium]|nr:hypothetical protein [Deltaproteobacteria bacterium]